MFRWVTQWWRRREVARVLRERICRARPGLPRALRSLPPFAELLKEAVRVRAAGQDYAVEVAPEEHRGDAAAYRPERIYLLPPAPPQAPR